MAQYGLSRIYGLWCDFSAGLAVWDKKCYELS